MAYAALQMFPYFGLLRPESSIFRKKESFVKEFCSSGFHRLPRKGFLVRHSYITPSQHHQHTLKHMQQANYGAPLPLSEKFNLTKFDKTWFSPHKYDHLIHSITQYISSSWDNSGRSNLSQHKYALHVLACWTETQCSCHSRCKV